MWIEHMTFRFGTEVDFLLTVNDLLRVGSWWKSGTNSLTLSQLS